MGFFLLFNQTVENMTIYPPHLCEQHEVWATKTQNPHFLCPYCPQTHNLHAGPQALPLHPQASGGTFRRRHSGNLGLWWSPVWDSKFQRLMRICWRDGNFQEKAQWTYRCIQGWRRQRSPRIAGAGQVQSLPHMGGHGHTPASSRALHPASRPLEGDPDVGISF